MFPWLPRRGSQVLTPQGMGQVLSQNVLQESVNVRLLDGDTVATFALSELKPVASESDQRGRKRGRRR